MEVWKKVVGYEDTYEVSNTGLVRSLDRIIHNKCYGDKRVKGKLLSIKGKTAHGYIVVNLCKNATQKVVAVHILVAEAFLGPRPQGMHVLHSKAVTKEECDNSVGNLRYGSREENMDQSVTDGNQFRKLSREAIRAIRKRYGVNGVTLKMLADEYGVSISNISCVVRKQTFKNL